MAQVQLRLGIALLGGFFVPLCGGLVVGLRTQTFLENFADGQLRRGVAFLGFRQPDVQGAGVIGTVVGDIFAAADFAIRRGGANRSAGAEIGHLRAEFAYLAGQQAIDHKQFIGIGYDVAFGGLGHFFLADVAGASRHEYAADRQSERTILIHLLSHNEPPFAVKG